MKVQLYTFSAGNSIQNQRLTNFSSQSISRMNNLESDMFVKSANDVSFTGVDKKNKIKDIAKDLAMIGIIGAPFALSIGAASYAMKHMDVKDIFLPDGTYLMSVDELKTDKITANAEEGILKIEGTPIDIDASRYDVADIERGVFKNFDGSVDIDLSNNKYIDIDHGVMIDPDREMSFIKNADGIFENIAIPALNSPNFQGSPLSAINGGTYRHNLTREEYIEKTGHAPEHNKVLNKIYHDEGRISKDGYKVVDPDDNRTISQKIIDFFNPFSPDGKVNNLYDRSKSYDVFGREIITIEKPDGSISKIGLDENLKAILNRYHLETDSLGEISDFFEKIKMKEYLLEYHPQSASAFTAQMEHFNEFLHRIAENHSDVADIITNDAITEAVTNNELPTSLLDILRDIAESF